MTIPIMAEIGAPIMAQIQLRKISKTWVEIDWSRYCLVTRLDIRAAITEETPSHINTASNSYSAH